MAKRGTKPLPTALKLLKGTRTDRINLNEPASILGRLDQARFLDDHAQELWDELLPILTQMRVLSKADKTALTSLCQAYSRWRIATIDLQENGIVFNTDLGGVKANPAAQVCKQAEDTMIKLLCEFGLTPSSRSRITVAPEKAKDELNEFLNKKA